jgi:hypothetical protein
MPVNFPFAQPIAPPTAPRVTDDFNYATSPTTYKLHWVNAGSNSYTAAAATSANERGLLSFSISSVGQKGGLRAGSALAFPAPGLLLFGTAIKPGILSSPTNRYQIQIGIFDNTLNSVNGFGFRYQDDINAGKWQCFGGADTFDSGEGTNVDTNRFRIYCYGPGLPVLFMVNDRIVGSLVAPLFPGTLWPAITFEKTVGASSRGFNIDYAGLYWTRPDVELPQ